MVLQLQLALGSIAVAAGQAHFNAWQTGECKVAAAHCNDSLQGNAGISQFSLTAYF